MYNFHPADQLIDHLDLRTDEWITCVDPDQSCGSWLSNILGFHEETPETGWPAAYVEDPFVIGVAHGFSLAFAKDQGFHSPHEDPTEPFARRIFQRVFGDKGAAQYERALRLRQFKHKDYAHGADNGQWFFIAYRHELEYLQHPDVAEAIQRATAYVPSRTAAAPGSAEYQLWFRSAEDCALYDVLFLDIVRSRFPDLVEWRGSALETMDDPTLGGNEEWPSLDEAPALQGVLAFPQPGKA